MEIKLYRPEMSDKEQKDLAYWERNTLALHFAQGWYNDDVEPGKPRFTGWRRALSLLNGSITFHVPDDYDVGNLPQIKPNWDGHSTPVKWRNILEKRGIKVIQPKEKKELTVEEAGELFFQKAINRIVTMFPDFTFKFDINIEYDPKKTEQKK